MIHRAIRGTIVRRNKARQPDIAGTANGLSAVHGNLQAMEGGLAQIHDGDGGIIFLRSRY